jgi:hypothetical protein
MKLVFEDKEIGKIILEHVVKHKMLEHIPNWKDKHYSVRIVPPNYYYGTYSIEFEVKE